MRSAIHSICYLLTPAIEHKHNAKRIPIRPKNTLFRYSKIVSKTYKIVAL